jgi:hypothetical protein
MNSLWIKKITFFTLSFLCAANTACTTPTINKLEKQNVKFICDFKTQKPSFYEYTDKKIIEKINLGLEEITPIFNKFIGEKIINIDSIEYLEGYFLSINEFNGKIAPNPIGHAYVKYQTDLYCLNINSLF